MIKTKVCIVGSGPAGAATSLMLAKHKIQHYIIDKATFPRDKTCGDGLILYAYKSLKLIDEDLFKKFLNHPKIVHSNDIKLHISNDVLINFKEVDPNRPRVISFAKRIDFDHFLVENLSKTYATTEFGNPVKIIEERTDGIYLKLKDGKEILAEIVVGADGVSSIVSKKLGNNLQNDDLHSTFINAYYKNVAFLPVDYEAEIRMIYKKMLLFFYIFPLGDGTVNVSLGGTSHLIKKYDINLVEALEEILKTHPKIAYKFANAEKVGRWRGWTIPFSFGKQNVFGNRFLLVGDAAGLANAFYKEGVGTAMMSGIICANKINECVKANNFSASFLASYQKDLHKEFYKLLRFSKFALKLARNERLFAFLTRLLKKQIYLKAPKAILNRSY